jgi:iron complex outermembrane recepter protein
MNNRVKVVASIPCWIALLSFFIVSAIQAVELEEVIVTAQKKEQSLQEVPISIIALQGAALQEFGITSWDNVELPGVHISQGGTSDVIFVRGIGSAQGIGFEQSVPMYIDGTYFGRAFAQRLGFLDLGQIEVLKGPQPTYLGKNAVGGAISITSQRPTDELEAFVDVSYEFEGQEVEVFSVVSGPLSDTLKARAAIKYRDLDGYLRNEATGEDEVGREDLVARVSAIWEPADNIEVFTKFEYARDKTLGGDTQLFNCVPGGTSFDAAVEDCVFNKTRASTFNNANFVTGANADLLTGMSSEIDDLTRFRDFEIITGQVSIDWEVADGYVVSSNTAYMDHTFLGFAKADHSTLSLLAAGGDEPIETFNQFSQELRILSPQDRRFRWMAGAYYDRSNLNTTTNAIIRPDLFGAPFIPPPNPFGLVFDLDTQQDDESWAVFGEAEYDLIDPLTVKFGFRYSEVKKDADLSNGTGFGAPGPIFFLPANTVMAARKDTDFQPAMTLQWRPADDYMFYASWKEGFKAGGFDHGVTVPTVTGVQFEPEEVTAYEVGGKLKLLDGAATLNFALFRAEFSNLQVFQFDSVTSLFRTINAGESLSEGVEVSGQWAATNNLTLSANISYLDAEYESFPGALCYISPPQTVAQGCTTVAGVTSQDLTGAPLTYAPEWSGQVTASHVYPMGTSIFGQPIELRTNLSVFLTSEFQTDFDGDPDTIQSGYYKLDLRVGIASQDDKWEVAFVGRNLTDRVTALFMGDQPGGNGQAHFATAATPRQLGVQFRYNFY